MRKIHANRLRVACGVPHLLLLEFVVIQYSIVCDFLKFVIELSTPPTMYDLIQKPEMLPLGH